MRRRGFILVISASLPLGFAAAWYRLRRREPAKAIPTSGGELFDRSAIRTPHFLQTDPSWAKEQVGGSDESLAKVGCTICCVAMVLGGYGIDLTPRQLNEAVKKMDGYTASGLLKWDSLIQVSSGKVRPDYVGAPDTTRIDKALKGGHPVIAKVMLKGVVQHWVLIVGKEGAEYLVRDPLQPGIVKLSAVANNIYAIRILKPG